MRGFRLLLAALVLAFGLAWTAYAMEVQPLRVLLVPAQGQTAATIAINNTRTDALPYEISVERRFIDEDGMQTFAPAEEDFVVFPPQGLVPAGGTQAVRFQYLGPTEVTETQGYVIRVKEVPVRQEGFSGIQFAYSFGVAVYIQPPGAEDDLKIADVVRDGDQVSASLVNQGNDYSLLTTKRMRLSVGGQRLTYERDELSQIIPNPLIAPGASRKLVMTIPGLPAGEIEELAFLN